MSSCCLAWWYFCFRFSPSIICSGLCKATGTVWAYMLYHKGGKNVTCPERHVLSVHRWYCWGDDVVTGSLSGDGDKLMSRSVTLSDVHSGLIYCWQFFFSRCRFPGCGGSRKCRKSSHRCIVIQRRRASIKKRTAWVENAQLLIPSALYYIASSNNARITVILIFANAYVMFIPYQHGDDDSGMIVTWYDMIWYDIYSFARGTTLSMKQSSDNIIN